MIKIVGGIVIILKEIKVVQLRFNKYINPNSELELAKHRN